MTARLVLLLAALLSASLGAAPPAATAPEGQVRALIAQLGDDQYSVREKATQDLLDLGEAALPALREVQRTTADAEVRHRAQHVITTVEKTISRREGRIIGGARALRIWSTGDGGETTHVAVTDRECRRIEIRRGKDGLAVTVTSINPDDGRDVVQRYAARDAEELKKKHPEAFPLYAQWSGALEGKINVADAAGNPIALDADATVQIRGGGALVFANADALPILRRRLLGQMKAAKTPPAPQQEVLKLMERLIVLESGGDDDEAPVSRQPGSEFDRVTEDLWKQLDALKLSDPDGALAPPAARRLGVGIEEPAGRALPGAGAGGAGAGGAEAGVRVSTVYPGSRGDRLGLRPGDLLRKVNGQEVPTIGKLRALVSQTKEPLVIEVERGGEKVELKEKR